MKKFSMKKISILGLVLIGASAVTAAIIPSNSYVRAEGADNGTLQPSPETNNGLTCVQDEPEDFDFSCNVTDATISTANAGNGDSNVGSPLTDQTENNTSQTDGSDLVSSIVS